MELFELVEIAKKEKIDLANFRMKKSKARIIKNNNSCCIFMNYAKIDTYTEEKCTLAEELGHYYYDAYYSASSSAEEIERQEYKALKWKSLVCVPLKSILNCFRKGICNLVEIAEELQVEPEMVEFAYNYYRENSIDKNKSLY